jgi:hypothetical protein
MEFVSFLWKKANMPFLQEKFLARHVGNTRCHGDLKYHCHLSSLNFQLEEKLYLE